MDEPDSYKEFIRENILALILGGIGVICLGYGLIYYFGSQDDSAQIQFEEGVESAQEVSAAEKASAQSILIDVAGAVAKPGVYTLKKEARLQDAIVAAGGMSNDANHELVAREMNLAAKLTDGTKIYIPFAGETNVQKVAAIQSESGQGALININSASTSQLEDLPGIGNVTATKIIDNRPYASIDELREKSIISAKVYDQIKEMISTY